MNVPSGGQHQGCGATLGRPLGGQTHFSRVASLPPVRIPSRKEYVCKSASGPLSRPALPGRHSYVCRSMSGPLSRPRWLAFLLPYVPCFCWSTHDFKLLSPLQAFPKFRKQSSLSFLVHVIDAVLGLFIKLGLLKGVPCSRPHWQHPHWVCIGL